MISVNSEKIEHLYKIKKNCSENIRWVSVPDSQREHLTFQVPVITLENELLYWYGYYEKNKHGFTLMFNKKYCIRSWDMAKRHYSKIEKRYVKGIGQHKHYHLDYETPRDVYSIPIGEISISDPNKAVEDFAKECNINLTGGYQSYLFR